jgi:hypothetical protein
MSWQRDTEVLATEWTTFTKDLGKGRRAFLEEVNRNPSLPANWRLRIQEPSGETTSLRTGQKTAVMDTLDQWAFKLSVTEGPSLKQATKKADELLEAHASPKPEPKVEFESTFPVDYGDGPGEWIWKESRPEFVPGVKASKSGASETTVNTLRNLRQNRPETKRSHTRV